MIKKTVTKTVFIITVVLFMTTITLVLYFNTSWRLKGYLVNQVRIILSVL